MESGTECSIGMVLVSFNNILEEQVMLLIGHFIIFKRGKNNTRRNSMSL